MISNRKRNRKKKNASMLFTRTKNRKNSSLIEEELDEALAGCAGSSPGPDHIHYDFIKKMARTEKFKLLEVYVQIRKTGAFPQE
jgi:hypothetical protein